MIKITKPFRYANFTTINDHIIRDDKFLKMIKSDLKKLTYLPKNTLRAKFLRFEIGQNGDDFLFDKYTLRATFEIIKFKR